MAGKLINRISVEDVPKRGADVPELMGYRTPKGHVYEKDNCRWRYSNGALHTFIEYPENYRESGCTLPLVRYYSRDG